MRYRFIIGILFLLSAMAFAVDQYASSSRPTASNIANPPAPEAMPPALENDSQPAYPTAQLQEKNNPAQKIELGSAAQIEPPIIANPDAITASPVTPIQAEASGKINSSIIAPVSGAVLLTDNESSSALKAKAVKRGKPGNIPVGFESLFDDQHSLVDVYYAGRFIGTAMATFNPDTIRFDDPKPVVDKIPNTLAPEDILESLSGDLATNQEFRCYHKGQRNCGQLDPEISGVIFNEDNYRVDIFVNPSLLSVQQSTSNKFLPASDSDLSFLQTLNYAFAGSDDDFNEEDNLFATSLLSYRENAIRMVSNYSDDTVSPENNFQVNTLVGQRDWQGIRYLGGYFQTINEDLRFSQETDVVGLRIGTSLDTREDQRQTSGRDIQVFLQSRGEVSIFKDDRLVSTRIYDAGNQILDTSNLPGGSYDIDIRIRDAGGERVETQFYVKNSSLPPQGEPRYFVELGRVTELDGDTLPDPIDLYLLRGSINNRINFNNTLIAGLSTTEDDSVGELGWYGLGNHYDVLVTTAVGRYDRYGFNTEARFNYNNAWLTTVYRRIWDDSTDSDNLDDADYGKINLIGDEQEQFTANLTLPVGIANLSFGARYIDRFDDEGSVTDYNASVDFELFRTQDSNIRFRLQYNHSDDDDFVVASLNWRLGAGHWTFQAQPEYEYNDIDGQDDDFARLNASADWDSRDKWASDVRAGVNATFDDDFNSFGANADWGGQYGRARGQVEHVDRDEGGSTTRHNGNMATSFMLADNVPALGGKEQNQAAVIIDLKGGAENVFFDVLVNGSRRATARPGQKSVVSLRPFETYRISLRARGEQFVYFDDKEYSITLYPGNVIKLDWEADIVNIVFGRIKDQHGKPVKNALLKGVAGIATTDDYGIFQAEIKSSTEQLSIETIDSTCAITLPEFTPRRGIASIGSLQCELQAK